MLYYIVCLKDLERFTIYSVMFKTWKWKANFLCLKVQNIFFITMWLNWTESQCELLPSFCNCHYLMNLQSLTSDISRSSFIHSSVCCLSVHHTVLFCHISLTLHWLQCIAQFDMAWWRVTLFSSQFNLDWSSRYSWKIAAMTYNSIKTNTKHTRLIQGTHVTCCDMWWKKCDPSSCHVKLCNTLKPVKG
jgi:hypothetical protein